MIVGLCLAVMALIVFFIWGRRNESFVSDDGPLYTKMHEQLLQMQTLWRSKQQLALQTLTPMCDTESQVEDKLRNTLTAGYAADRGDTNTTSADITRANKEIAAEKAAWSDPLFNCLTWKSRQTAKILNEGFSACAAGDLVVPVARAGEWNKLFKDVADLEKAIAGRPDLGPILATEAWMQSVIQPSIDRMKANQKLEGFATGTAGLPQTTCVKRADIVAAGNTLSKIATIMADQTDETTVQKWKQLHQETTTMINTLNNYANTSTSAHTVD